MIEPIESGSKFKISGKLISLTTTSKLNSFDVLVKNSSSVARSPASVIVNAVGAEMSDFDHLLSQVSIGID